MRERSDREDLSNGEYASEELEEGVRKGEPGCELTRRISSDMGVDLVREIEYACEGTLEELAMGDVGGGLLRYEGSLAGRIFSYQTYEISSVSLYNRYHEITLTACSCISSAIGSSRSSS